jgi:hypothetical protein
MLSTHEQVEIANRGMDAVFGYALAAINAAFEVNARTLTVWTEVANSLSPKPPKSEETWEWSGAPRRPHSTLLAAEQEAVRPSLNPFAVWSEFVEASGRAWFTGPPSPFAWWAWAPQSAVPATWPWAYGMISSGVPGSVAWPMAEANVALMDAAQKTAEATCGSFPAYRSDNGFAAAQVWTQPAIVQSIIAAAPAASLLWPWLKQAA